MFPLVGLHIAPNVAASNVFQSLSSEEQRNLTGLKLEPAPQSCLQKFFGRSPSFPILLQRPSAFLGSSKDSRRVHSLCVRPCPSCCPHMIFTFRRRWKPVPISRSLNLLCPEGHVASSSRDQDVGLFVPFPPLCPSTTTVQL